MTDKLVGSNADDEAPVDESDGMLIEMLIDSELVKDESTSGVDSELTTAELVGNGIDVTKELGPVEVGSRPLLLIEREVVKISVLLPALVLPRIGEDEDKIVVIGKFVSTPLLEIVVPTMVLRIGEDVIANDDVAGNVLLVPLLRIVVSTPLLLIIELWGIDRLGLNNPLVLWASELGKRELPLDSDKVRLLVVIGRPEVCESTPVEVILLIDKVDNTPEDVLIPEPITDEVRGSVSPELVTEICKLVDSTVLDTLEMMVVPEMLDPGREILVGNTLLPGNVELIPEVTLNPELVWELVSPRVLVRSEMVDEPRVLDPGRVTLVGSTLLTGIVVGRIEVVLNPELICELVNPVVLDASETIEVPRVLDPGRVTLDGSTLLTGSVVARPELVITPELD